MDIGKRIRDLREERGLTQREVAQHAGLTPSGLGFIEHGQTQNPSAETVVAIARALGVPVEDLLKGQVLAVAGKLEDGPALEELHGAARCATGWLIKPEAEWRASWPRSLTPREAMQIVQEMADEFAAVKPLMAAQEVGLPIYKSATRGRYRQAWLRFLEGMQLAHNCGVAYGLITQDETLNDLEKELGEPPGVLENRARYEEMLTIGAA
jgi:transcriptional regulator with XRE-family HTH domain